MRVMRQGWFKVLGFRVWGGLGLKGFGVFGFRVWGGGLGLKGFGG